MGIKVGGIIRVIMRVIMGRLIAPAPLSENSELFLENHPPVIAKKHTIMCIMVSKDTRRTKKRLKKCKKYM